MKHYFKARQKGKEEFVKEFPNKIAEVIDDFGSTTKSDLQSFLDSYSKDIRKAVIEDVREKIEGIQTNDGKIRSVVESTKLLILSTLISKDDS